MEMSTLASQSLDTASPMSPIKLDLRGLTLVASKSQRRMFVVTKLNSAPSISMLHPVCLSHIEVSAKLLHGNYRSVSFLIGFESNIWFVKGIQSPFNGVRTRLIEKASCCETLISASAE